MKKNIIIRVDGDSTIGYGHLIRCLGLANILNPYFTVNFFTKEIPENYKNFILRSGFNLFLIRSEKDFFSHLKGKEMVVVDGYQFDDYYFYQLKSKGIITISIQDIYIKNKNIDVVINHLPNLEENYRGLDAYVGPEYAIIRPEFLRNCKKKLPAENTYFICFGGTLNYNQLNSTVKIIRRNKPDSKLHILTTDENKPFLSLDSCSNAYSNLNANEIVNLIDQADYCFITPGMIMYEVLSRNKKALVGALNEGQNRLAQDFEKLGLIKNVGLWDDLNLSILQKAMITNNFDMNKIETIFDRKSDKRLVKIFLDYDRTNSL